MTTPTIHSAEHDLAVIREVRDRILAGDWSERGASDTRGRKCLVLQLIASETAYIAVLQAAMALDPYCSLGRWNRRSRDLLVDRPKELRADLMSRNKGVGLRWFLWHWLVKVPAVCNSNAHSLLIWRSRRSPLIGPMCREDYARNGTCWCGKLQ